MLPFKLSLIKTIDEQFLEVGFSKTEDTEYAVVYQRYDTDYEYTHEICILHKENGRHLVQSYDPALFDTENLGCTNVGLTSHELKLIYKKMREKGWLSK